MSANKALLILFWIVVTISGCVIPIPYSEVKVRAGRPVTEEQQTFLKTGETTKDIVLTQLGAPRVIWEDARIFVYEWEVSHGVLIWAVAHQMSGLFAGGVDLTEGQMLIIQFDATDRVQRFERTTRPAFRPYDDFLRAWAMQPLPSPPEHRQTGGEVHKGD